MHVCVCMSVFVHASKLLNERAVTVAEEKESLVNTKEGRDIRQECMPKVDIGGGWLPCGGVDNVLLLLVHGRVAAVANSCVAHGDLTAVVCVGGTLQRPTCSVTQNTCLQRFEFDAKNQLSQPASHVSFIVSLLQWSQTVAMETTPLGHGSLQSWCQLQLTMRTAQPSTCVLLEWLTDLTVAIMALTFI